MGSIVGQIAKIKGCRVVGIAGGEAKVRWLTDELGFDAAVDYKSPEFERQLRAAVPDGIDVYFDNTGGDVFEACLFAMKNHGRIACCGALSQYDGAPPPHGPRGVPGLIVTKRLTLRGFVVMDFADQNDKALADLQSWVASGKLKVQEDIIDGLENRRRPSSACWPARTAASGWCGSRLVATVGLSQARPRVVVARLRRPGGARTRERASAAPTAREPHESSRPKRTAAGTVPQEYLLPAPSMHCRYGSERPCRGPDVRSTVPDAGTRAAPDRERAQRITLESRVEVARRIIQVQRREGRPTRPPVELVHQRAVRLVERRQAAGPMPA